MAKLNGVKTVDMVNGEITKVAYEGVEYTKVEQRLFKGDIILVKDAWGSQHKGEFFVDIAEDHLLYSDEGDFVYIKGNSCPASTLRKHVDVFRKISADKPALEQVAKRVENLESDVAALKSGDSSLKGEKVIEESKRLTVGDIAKVIGDESGHFGDIGDIVKIVADDEDDQPYRCERISDGKDVGWFYESELEAHVEETIEFEGATYRKVEREAREGDVVIFRKNRSVSVDIDKPYKVVFSNYGGGNSGPGVLGHYRVYKDCYGRTRETVDVYEPIEPAKYVPQEGDIVVVESLDKASSRGSRVKIGDIGKVGERGTSDPGCSRIFVPGGATRVNFVHLSEVRKATPTEVEKYEQAVKDAEIAEKWAKIGRKAEEIRKGDVVKVTSDCGRHKIGTIGIAQEDGDVYSTSVLANGIGTSTWSFVELIAPVESLF